MEHDTPEAAHIGVDVSKGWLDAHELPSGRSRRFENSGKGYREFRAWVGAGPVGLVLFEATGPYDRAFHAALGGGLPLCRVNASWARHFRKSLGREAKTDRADAALLAAMARTRRDLRATPVRPESLRALEALWTARGLAAATPLDKSAIDITNHYAMRIMRIPTSVENLLLSAQKIHLF